MNAHMRKMLHDDDYAMNCTTYEEITKCTYAYTLTRSVELNCCLGTERLAFEKRADCNALDL